MLNTQRQFKTVLLFLATTCLATAFTNNSQSGITVYSGETGRPLQGAVVNASPSGYVTVTGENGQFNPTSFEQGDTISISYLGYTTFVFIIENPDKTEKTVVYLTPSTIDYAGVTIQGFESRNPYFLTPVSASYISGADLQRFDNTSLQPVISTAPGVRMEERTPGSYRLSIRGSTLREPFGVRNVKVYWNGIPFTEPGGNTHLNLIDHNLIDDIEILRGPAGSIYGAGTGGVVLLNSRTVNQENTGIRITAQGGSYGQLSSGINLNTGSANADHSLKAVHRQSEGYREHTALQRTSLLYTGKYRLDEKNSFSAMLHITDYHYQIPGALTREQLEEDRTQAAPPTPFRPGSVEQNASIHMENYWMGGGYKYRYGRFSNNLRMAGMYRSFDHPFNLDYKRSAEHVFNIRNVAEYKIPLFESEKPQYRTTDHEFDFPDEAAYSGVRDLKITAGGELQRGFMSFRNYGNQGGTPDTLILDDEIQTTRATVFLQGTINLPYKIDLTAGASVNVQEHQLIRLSDAPANPDDYARQVRFDPVISPRIALMRRWDENLAIFLSYSDGFSPPTINEVRTSDGNVNYSLNPERGRNLETGIRFRLPELGVSTEMTLFSFQALGTIVSYTNPQGVVLFQNSGSTQQNGLELATGWRVFHQIHNLFSGLDLKAAYTLSSFYFDEYVDGDEDYSGNRLTGIPPHTFNFKADATFFNRLILSFNGYYEDAIPLNDENSVLSDSFVKMDTRLSYQFNIAGKMQGKVYAGVNNLFNAEYSLGNDLNAFGERYFQPAPLRSFFGGLQIGFDW